MATGIRDKVAILGMGCSRFGERWDCGADDLMVEAFTECIADAGIEFELKLPHRAFHRKVGDFAKLSVTPAGAIVDAAEWQRGAPAWLADTADLEYVASLMQPCHTVGRFAPWIAPPVQGVGGKPGDFEYVRLAS